MSETARARKKRKAAPATAAGQALGYSLQFTRLTAMLLEAPEGSACSLEVLEDVAEESPDGQMTLAQLKSALADNPVADHAVPLWKTLFNWLELAKGDFVDPAKTIFELYVSRQVDGPIIRSFHDAQSAPAAKAALAKARSDLWGEPPAHSKRNTLSDGIRQYVNVFLATEDDLPALIVTNLRLRCGSGSPQNDIEAAFRRGPVSEAKVSDIANQMCGWVKRKVDKLLEKGLPAIVSRDEFHREYVSYVRRVDRDQILKSMTSMPSDAERQERLCDTFVQQLGLIELDFDGKLEAISDCLRARSDRARWSEAGYVHEDSFSELNDVLGRTWQNHKRAVAVEAASRTELERGQLLHARCMGQQTRVQGMDPPPHFVPGCFHDLADDMTVGWHPNFRKMLGKPSGKGKAS